MACSSSICQARCNRDEELRRHARGIKAGGGTFSSEALNVSFFSDDELLFVEEMVETMAEPILATA